MDPTMISSLGTLLSTFGFPVVVAGYLIYSIQPQLKALSETVTSLKTVVESSMATQQFMITIMDKQNANAVSIAEALAKIDTKLSIT